MVSFPSSWREHIFKFLLVAEYAYPLMESPFAEENNKKRKNNKNETKMHVQSQLCEIILLKRKILYIYTIALRLWYIYFCKGLG